MTFKGCSSAHQIPRAETEYAGALTVVYIALERATESEHDADFR